VPSSTPTCTPLLQLASTDSQSPYGVSGSVVASYSAIAVRHASSNRGDLMLIGGEQSLSGLEVSGLCPSQAPDHGSLGVVLSVATVCVRFVLVRPGWTFGWPVLSSACCYGLNMKYPL
jgi:hypothetical protein